MSAHTQGTKHNRDEYVEAWNSSETLDDFIASHCPGHSRIKVYKQAWELRKQGWPLKVFPRAKKRTKERLPAPTLPCPGCGIAVVTWSTRRKEVRAQPDKKRKFCSRQCHRKWFSERFARWAENPQPIHIPEDIDVFLNKDKLDCPVDGCTWRGVGLTAHANREHGIDKREFKRLCGLNQGTGVITQTLSQHLREVQLPHVPERLVYLTRAQQHNATTALLPKSKDARLPKSKDARLPKSKEARLHMSKARKALAADKNNRKPLKSKICGCCGGEVKVLDMYHGASAYCSLECRKEARRRRETPNPGALRPCVVCGVLFPTLGKQRFCTPACRRQSLAAPLIDLKCVICGKTFSVPDNGLGRRRKTCNVECSNLHTRQLRVAWKQQHRQNQIPDHE